MFYKFFCLLTFTLVLAFSVPAQAPARDMQREAALWHQLSLIAPEKVEDFKAATIAMDSGNYAEAVRLYQVVKEKTPDFDPVLRRLGWALIVVGKPDEGFRLIEETVQHERSPENLMSLATALAYPGLNKEGTPAQKSRAYSLALEAEQKPKTGDDADYELLLGQLALENNQIDVFRRVTGRLEATHQELVGTHYFSAILAAYDQHWMKAESEIRKAQSLGLSQEAVQAFLDSGVSIHAAVYRYSMSGGALIGVWILGLFLLFLVGKVMSKQTLKSIENADPNVGATNSDLSLRKWYRRLIGISGVYYYISLPFVMVLVVGLAAAATYFSYMSGQLYIKLLLGLWLGAVITIYKMVRSLFLKIERADPGRSLTQEEAPALWDLMRAVAATIGTRAADEIRVTPGTDLAVYEKGSWRERSSDQAKRILILGIGVLNDFDLNGFRAVLAHEYGHFSHRDTAGGDVALRVNSDMMRFANAMVASRQNVWWNLAFHFLRVYHFIFRRISHGATRLQEVLADRVAAAKYGATAFESGLRHVIEKSVEFEALARKELNACASGARALQNLYELSTIADPNIKRRAKETLNRQTSEDDTHPSPNDRFRLTRKIVLQSEPSISGMVWDLFKDRAALTKEMTEMVQTSIAR